MDLNLLTVDIANTSLQLVIQDEAARWDKERFGSDLSAFPLAGSVALGRSHLSELQYFDL